MTNPNDNQVKILFRFFSNLLDEWTVEILWAQPVNKVKGLYAIDNIPFYASVASGDIVFAEYDDKEQMLTYRELIESSGNSIIQVVLLDKNVSTDDIRDIFKTFECHSEKYSEGYFVLEVPAHKDYQPIKQKLSDLRDKKIIDYAEPVLSENHWY